MSMEVSEDTVQASLEYLAKTDRAHAVARAEVNALEDLTKTVLAFEFEYLQGAVEARKIMAHKSDTYIAHIEKKKQAQIEFFEMDNKRKRAALSIEIWRSINANRRQGNT